jgi:hypothetical protein
LSYRERRPKGSYGSQIRRAKKVQAKRSSWAKHIDSKLKAPKARSVDEWLSAPTALTYQTLTPTNQKNHNLLFSIKCQSLKNLELLI